jgi:monoamine oxidase
VSDAPDVLVLGGGFAGVVAARELGAAGHSVRLLEARDRLGGRTWFRRDALAGHDLEMGGAWIVPDQHHVWAEVARYGLEVPFWGLPSSFGWVTGGVLRRGALPVPQEELPELERLLLAMRDAAARLDLAQPLAGQDVADLDSTPSDVWLAQLSLPTHTREIALAWFSGSGSSMPSEVSILEVVRWLAAAGNSIWRWLAASVLGYVLEDGTGSLVAAVAEDAGADVRLESPVLAVSHDASGVTVRTGGATPAEHRAAAAVIALPLNCLGDVTFEPPLVDGKRDAARERHAGHGSKVWARVDAAPAGFFGLGWRGGQGFDFVGTEEILEDSALLVCFSPDPSPARGGHDEIERAIRAFLPDATLLEFAAHDWTGDPYARGTWNAFRPGQIMRYETALRAGEGRLVFAGSHTAQLWPGFIDGAVESGLRAGAEASALLGASRTAS